ncbi:MAG: RNA ligase (ATP) [Oscillospiraceae bacterium]|jgi:RNA ligase (TIGR02306 family)|nr:RNA ligase (ATP) [Oscillospiraceae bacterium]
MRNLASIQKISAISPIPDADRIEVATVLGWNVVVGKGEYAPGDLAVYFEIDSYLPAEDARFEFLAKSSLRSSPDQGRKKGYRIKTAKLRGVVSQGLLMRPAVFHELGSGGLAEGRDVTDVLNVVKWDPPEIASGNIVGTPGRPHGVPMTDETRLQSIEPILESFVGKPYYITLKCDGTSCSAYRYNDSYGVTSREMALTVPDDPAGDNPYTAVYRSLDMRSKLEKLGRNIAVQGELCGPRIQGNRLGFREYRWLVFDAFDLDTRNYASLDELKEICAALNLEMVPVLEEGEAFPADYTLGRLLEKADCKYPSGQLAEGIVVRLSANGGLDQENGHALRASFKVLNNKFLLKAE